MSADDERDQVEKHATIILDAIARETGRGREWLSLEIEQVVTRALFSLTRAVKRPPRRRSTAPFNPFDSGEK